MDLQEARMLLDPTTDSKKLVKKYGSIQNALEKLADAREVACVLIDYFVAHEDDLK